ncbi:MAG: hypothetical protein ACO1SV_02130 [Fimbriimonas sp.]
MAARNGVDELIERSWLTRSLKDLNGVREALAAFTTPMTDVVRESLDRLERDAELLGAVLERKSLQWSAYQREELLAILERITRTYEHAVRELERLMENEHFARRSLLECGGPPPL